MSREDSLGVSGLGCMRMHLRNGAERTFIPTGSLNPDKTSYVDARIVVVNISHMRFVMYREDNYAARKCQSRF